MNDHVNCVIVARGRLCQTQPFEHFSRLSVRLSVPTQFNSGNCCLQTAAANVSHFLLALFVAGTNQRTLSPSWAFYFSLTC